jgi:hydroxymethylglutaryl-CoA lyase
MTESTAMSTTAMSTTAALPMRSRRADLPARVRVREVGPRDGLQNESAVLPAEVKTEFIGRLVAAGLREIEATSFVHPKWVPQLADADQVLPSLPTREGVRYAVLVPNERGLDRLLNLTAPPSAPASSSGLAQSSGRAPASIPAPASGLGPAVGEVAIFASATETFAAQNLNRTIDESLLMFAPVVSRARSAGLAVRGYLSMCFGDPWEGAVPIRQVVDVGTRLLDLGCDELSLGDTIGTGTPGHVSELLSAFDAAGVPATRIGVHFHDTYGQALANTLAALERGVTVIDVSAGGLGGCPFAKSATGNLATEDLVWMLDGLGIETGIDLEALVATSAWMAERLGRPSPSRVVRALHGTNGRGANEQGANEQGANEQKTSE